MTADLESRLVWIFGSPRSGSTWLLQLLAHPLTPVDRPPLGVELREAADAGPPRAVPINEPYIPQHLTPALFEEPPADGGLAVITLNAFRHADPSYFLSDSYADAWRPALRQLVLARLDAQARAIAVEHSLDDPLVVVKEPNGSLGAELVLSLLPRSRLIFLLRDGRDVVDSMLDAQAPGSWLERGAGEPRLEAARRQAQLWLGRTEAVQRAYDAHAPELRRLVRYEHLRADSEHELGELDRWLGLERDRAERASAIRWNDFDSYPEEVKGPGRPLRAARPGLWRESLGAAEQEAVHAILGDKLLELGYEPRH